MKTSKGSVAGCCAAAILSMLATELVWAGTEGATNTFYGQEAGFNNSASNYNSFFGAFSGLNNTTGSNNTSVGYGAGIINQTGSGNVFLGYAAGSSESGSNKLYIDNCSNGAPCTSPFIYGEFDNHLLWINGAVGVSANGAAKSQLHFSLAATDVGGWITTALDNNLYLSSGAMYDESAGGWIQKSPDGYSAVVGSQTANGYTMFLQQGATAGNPVTLEPKFQVLYNGSIGMGKAADGTKAIDTATGAYLSTGGVWVSISSRASKENIKALSSAQAMQALAELNPVTYNYKVDAQEKHVGFIAEDVPELVASKDRKGLSALDIVAVLTKVVQEKSRVADEQTKVVDEQRRALESLAATVSRLEAEVNRLKNREVIAQK